MNGKRVAGGASRVSGREAGAGARHSFSQRLALRRPQSGFTLLELMIVISILVILAMIAVAQYNKTVLAAKEATLREDLFQMRRMIDQYYADKAKLPQSLDDLVTAGYVTEIPVDPMTDQRDWQVEFGEDPGSSDNSQGVINVRSASNDLDSEGSRRYSEW
ncbi:MAG TPA: type II secretion system protein [Pyrinomonadaceae bacterium]|nr:type II secretion system protein [Pyrinomonadaceae bacterium]